MGWVIFFVQISSLRTVGRLIKKQVQPMSIIACSSFWAPVFGTIIFTFTVKEQMG